MGIDYGKLRHHPLGADEVPLNYDELQLVETAIFRRQAESSLAGQTLMSSLLQVTKDMMPWFLKGYPAAATRGFIGMERADALGVPPAGPARLAFEIVRITTRAFSPRVPGLGLAVFARHTTKRIYKKWIHEHGGQDPPWRT